MEKRDIKGGLPLPAIIAIIVVAVVVAAVTMAVFMAGDDDDDGDGGSDGGGGDGLPFPDGGDDGDGGDGDDGDGGSGDGGETGTGFVVSQYQGQVDDAGEEIIRLQFHISLSGGSESVDMLNLFIHASGTDDDELPMGFSEDFVHDDSDSAGSFPIFTVTEITDPLNSYDEDAGSYRLDSESTLRLDMEIGDILSDGLSPNSEITLKLMMSGGGYTQVVPAYTPAGYTAGEWVEMV